MKMMKVELMFMGRQVKALPAGAEVLSVQNQHEKIVVWVKVDSKAEPIPHTFFVVATGQEIPGGEYIGTVQLRGGGFIAHIFMGDDCAA